MPGFLKELFSSDGFMPHGHCYLWRPGVLWLNLISDALTALAYVSIPLTLLYIVRRRRDVPFHWMFLCFGAFIIACGTTHVMEIWTLWTPTYWLSGAIKAVTGTASIATAVLLVKLVPQALTLPTPTQLAKANAELQHAHDLLERRVAERTAELTQRNAELAGEIAERKRAEAALAHSEAQFRRLAEAGIIGVIGSDGEGYIRDGNAAFLQMTGYSPEELRAGRVHWTQLTPPEYHDADREAIAILRATGIVPLREKEYFRKDGSRVPVLIGGANIDLAGDSRVGFVLDLTERKRAEAEIRRLEQQREVDARFRALLEAGPDAMVVVDQRGRIVVVNAETEKLFDYRRADLLDQPVELLVPERLRAAHASHRERGGPAERRMMGGQQLIGRRRDGSEFAADITLSPLATRDGTLMVAAIRDATERNRTEQALRRAKDTAEAASAELEAFSYSVAHDLRTPLRSISGFSSLILDDCGDVLDAGSRVHFNRIIEAAQRMSDIIDALLSLARLTRIEPVREPVDLSALARAIVHQLRAADPARVVDVVIDDHLHVHGDPRLLRLVLENLLGNAWKFTGKQPAARVELGRQDIDGTTAYYVRDNGAGFDMTYADKLFSPFRRLHTQAEFDGTGIGLATVQRIVRRHGGRVWAESAEAKGATFRFTLPAGPLPPAGTLPPPTGPLPPVGLPPLTGPLPPVGTQPPPTSSLPPAGTLPPLGTPPAGTPPVATLPSTSTPPSASAPTPTGVLPPPLGSRVRMP